MSEDKVVETNLDSDLQIDNLPNRLTIFRIFLIPLVILPLYLTKHHFLGLNFDETTLGWFSGWVFTAASVTDFIDGYIARNRNLQTMFGSFLDPIADKFLIVSTLVVLLYLGRIHVIIVILLILREIYMTSLRLLATTEGLTIPVNSLGKWKTTTQMIGVGMLMPYTTWWIIPFKELGTLFVLISCLLSVFSAIQYSKNFVNRLKTARQHKKKQKAAQPS